MDFLSILWDFDPQIVDFLPPRWYGLLFGLAFITGQQVMTYVYKTEKLNVKELDWLLVYMVVGTILGARLGHCLFYDWSYYTQDLEHIISILYIWEGGLASHGGGIGLLLACFFFMKKFKAKSYLWVIDRVAIGVVIGGAFIRFGNFTNSEIVGHPTDKPWGVVFVENARNSVSRMTAKELDVTFEDRALTGEALRLDSGVELRPLTMTVSFAKDLSDDEANSFVKNVSEGVSQYGYPLGLNVLPESDSFVKIENLKSIGKGNRVFTFNAWGVPRHPAQLYESISCLLIFVGLFLLYKKYNGNTPDGLIFGLFAFSVFSLRFLYEFIKENQVDIEEGMILNIGQKLSIPLILFGLVMIVMSFVKKRSNSETSS